MKIVRNNGQEINSAEIGDNLMLQVEVQPASKLNIDLDKEQNGMIQQVFT